MSENQPPRPIWDPAPPWWWCRRPCWDPLPPWVQLDKEMEKRFAQMEIDFHRRELEFQMEKLGALEKLIFG